MLTLSCIPPVPSSYTSLSYLSASYNPSLYGTWPGSLTVGVYTGTQYVLGASGYYGLTGSGPTAVPTNGAGCSFGTSLGLSAPMYTFLQTAAAALDPSGAQLPSWRTLWQPCPPYSHGASQNSSSVMFGRSWAGIVCQDSSACTPTTMVGGVSQLQLSSLGLNGTIACGLSQLSTATTLDLHNNSLTGYIPSSFGRLSPLFSLTSLTALYLGGNQLVGSLPWTFGACQSGRKLCVFASPASLTLLPPAQQPQRARRFLHCRCPATRACVAFYRLASLPAT